VATGEGARTGEREERTGGAGPCQGASCLAGCRAELALGGLARGGARDAADEGARVGKGRRCQAELIRAKGRSASLDLGLRACSSRCLPGREAGGTWPGLVREAGGVGLCFFFFCVGLSVGGGQFWVLRSFAVKDANREIGMLFRSPLLESV
jgi:hypothetical protein